MGASADARRPAEGRPQNVDSSTFNQRRQRETAIRGSHIRRRGSPLANPTGAGAGAGPSDGWAVGWAASDRLAPVEDKSAASPRC